LNIKRLLLTLKEEARLKILAKTRRLSSRSIRNQLDHARAPLDSLRIQKCALENLSRPRQGYTFLLPCKSFALVTREISAASLSTRLQSVFFRLLKPFARPARSPVRFLPPHMSELQGKRNERGGGLPQLRAYSEGGADKSCSARMLGYIEQFDTSEEFVLDVSRQAMSFQQILESLTDEPCPALRLLNPIGGRIAKGMDADLVVLARLTLRRTLRHFPRCATTIRSGNIIYSEK